MTTPPVESTAMIEKKLAEYGVPRWEFTHVRFEAWQHPSEKPLKHIIECDNPVVEQLTQAYSKLGYTITLTPVDKMGLAEHER